MARKKEEVVTARRQRSESQLLQEIRSVEPTRNFAASLKTMAEQGTAIIAEIKQGSPSKGRIYPTGLTFDPAKIAQGYAKHGAACLSCLTDHDFFMGELEFVQQIRDKVTRPVLRKDFLYDPYQVVQSRAIGADAILLILSVLDLDQALELESAAFELGLDVLVEVHNEVELELAHELKTPLLGINNRNLKTFETTLDTSISLAKRAEAHRFVISESGIHTFNDILLLKDNGIQAFLIGEAFMREENPGEALGRMLESCKP